MRMMDVSGLKELLATPKRIVITTHHKPDGDAMGSSLGLYYYLLQKGHQVQVITPNDCPEFLQWLPGYVEAVDYEKHPEKAIALFNQAEILFCLDFNTESRVEAMADVLRAVKCTKVLIDHHLSPQAFCDYTFSFSDSCATCELVYDFICSMGDKHLLNKDIATCLYTGIMTDTGSFRFASMIADVHRKVADLIDAGAQNHKIHEAIYDNSSEDRLRLLGFALNEKLRVLPEYNVAFISATKEELNKFAHQTGDTEGLVNYALSIKGVKMAAFFAERKDLIKISFRSKGEFSVKEFAEKHFQGGGHRNASGGKADLPMEQAIQRFIDLLPIYKDKLAAN